MEDQQIPTHNLSSNCSARIATSACTHNPPLHPPTASPLLQLTCKREFTPFRMHAPTHSLPASTRTATRASSGSSPWPVNLGHAWGVRTA
jgi:hypothetical protein